MHYNKSAFIKFVKGLAQSMQQALPELELSKFYNDVISGLILCVHPATDGLCYNVTSSLIGWAHAQNDPCIWHVWCDYATVS